MLYALYSSINKGTLNKQQQEPNQVYIAYMIIAQSNIIIDFLHNNYSNSLSYRVFNWNSVACFEAPNLQGWDTVATDRQRATVSRQRQPTE